jgi:hypothetical protein
LAALVACVALGAVAGPLLLEVDWGLPRRILAGAFLGGWCGLLLTASRLLF